jgi:subtilisin family serine protease
MAYRNTAFVTPGHVISVGAIQEDDTRWVAPPLGQQEHYLEAACGCSQQCFEGSCCVTGASNYGVLVDIYAPGHNIASAHIFCSTCRRTIPNTRSGTSFSAAVVSGVVARMLQANPGLTPVGVWNQLQADATHVGFDIDPAPGVFNDMIVFRQGSVTCNPQYP